MVSNLEVFSNAKRFTPVLLALLLWLMLSGAALAQEPVEIPGYQVFKNDWSEVCDSSGDPLSSSFYPEDFQNFSTVPNSLSEPVMWFSTALPVELGTTYEYEPLSVQDLCYWSFILGSTGSQDAVSPVVDWSNRHIRFATAGFMYDLSGIPLTGYGWYFSVTWVKDNQPNQGSEIEDNHTIRGYLTEPVIPGYIFESIAPREGYSIKNIQLVFDRTDVPYYDWLPSPEMNVDRIVISGYEPDYNPTPTPGPTATPTRTPIVRPPTATSTPRPGLWDTPTPGPTPTGSPQAVATFPAQYNSIPTQIPPLQFPAWPAAPRFTPIPTPQPLFLVPLLPLTLTLPTVPTDITPIHTPRPLNYTLYPYPTDQPSPTPWPLTSQIISWTNWITANSTSAQTSTFTVANAPANYAPSLPRPLANVGYTFEQMRSAAQSGQAYSVAAWFALAGYIASIPIQFVKMMMQIADLLGPFGLFLYWLLAMLPFILTVRAFIFVKNLIINLINLAIKLVNFIGDLWDLIPGL